MPVMFDLVFKQQEDHADGHHIFWQVPYLALDMDIWQKCIQPWCNGEHRSPCQKPGDSDERSGRGVAISEPEMDTAAEIDGEQHRIESQVGTIAGPMLSEEQDGRESAIKADRNQT